MKKGAAYMLLAVGFVMVLVLMGVWTTHQKNMVMITEPVVTKSPEDLKYDEANSKFVQNMNEFVEEYRNK